MLNLGCIFPTLTFKYFHDPFGLTQLFTNVASAKRNVIVGESDITVWSKWCQTSLWILASENNYYKKHMYYYWIKRIIDKLVWHHFDQTAISNSLLSAGQFGRNAVKPVYRLQSQIFEIQEKVDPIICSLS